MDQKTIILTVFLTFSLFLLTQINESQAQENLVNFLTYTNMDFGFTMNYPSNWRVNQTNPDMGIAFISPDVSGIAMVKTGMSPMTIEEFRNMILSQSSNLSQSLNQRILEINSDNYFLSGYPAVRIVGIQNFGTLDMKLMTFWTIIGSNFYLVICGSPTDQFANALGTCQSMIDSFQVIKKE